MEATAFVRTSVRKGVALSKWHWQRVDFTPDRTIVAFTDGPQLLLGLEDVKSVSIVPSLSTLPLSSQPTEPPPDFRVETTSRDPPCLVLKMRPGRRPDTYLICVVDEDEQERWAHFLSGETFPAKATSTGAQEAVDEVSVEATSPAAG
mmetsp:Transcript_36228/g.83225  ORF Transcript_36228/g.83225 Transcript_36228/m.83225 type:complete len:148 (+) Transcript_36228:84-527(+)